MLGATFGQISFILLVVMLTPVNCFTQQKAPLVLHARGNFFYFTGLLFSTSVTFHFRSYCSEHGWLLICMASKSPKKYHKDASATLLAKAAGDRFLPAAQRDDKHCRPPFRVSFSSLL
jgi:hypothetical protein